MTGAMMADQNVAGELNNLHTRLDHHENTLNHFSTTLDKLTETSVRLAQVIEKLNNTEERMREDRKINIRRFDKLETALDSARTRLNIIVGGLAVTVFAIEFIPVVMRLANA